MRAGECLFLDQNMTFPHTGDGIVKEVILTGLQTLNKGSVETLAHTVLLFPGEHA